MPADGVTAFSWDDLDATVRELARQVRGDGLPSVIVGIQRGGLVPAVQLSHLLGIRTVVVLDIARTVSDAPNSAKITPRVRCVEDLSVFGQDVLLVDDVVGSGQTLRAAAGLIAAKHPERLRTLACVLNQAAWHRENTLAPDLTYVGWQVHGWVVFAWEVVAPEEIECSDCNPSGRACDGQRRDVERRT